MLSAKKAIKDWTSSFSSSLSPQSSLSSPFSHTPSSASSLSPSSTSPSRSPSPNSFFSGASKIAPSTTRKSNGQGKSRPKSMMRRLTLMKHGSASTSSSPLVFNKDSFERVLTEWDLFCEFKNYALVCFPSITFSCTIYQQLKSNKIETFQQTVDLCIENIRFWESVVEIEDLLADHDASYRNGLEDTSTSTWALSRFLNKPIASLIPVIDPVPVDIAPHFLYFHATFLARDAPLEVNVPGSIRTRIQSEMGRRKTNGDSGSVGSFSSDLFDKAIDEVISLLYLNTFKGFVAYREKNGPSKSVNMMGGGGGMLGSKANNRVDLFAWSGGKDAESDWAINSIDVIKSTLTASRRRLSFQETASAPSADSIDLDHDAQAAYLQILRETNFKPSSGTPAATSTASLKRRSTVRRASLDIRSSRDFDQPSPLKPLITHQLPPTPSPASAPNLSRPKPPPRRVMVTTKSNPLIPRLPSPLPPSPLSIRSKSALDLSAVDIGDIAATLSLGIVPRVPSPSIEKKWDTAPPRSGGVPGWPLALSPPSSPSAPRHAPILHDTFTPPSPSTPRSAPIVHDTFTPPSPSTPRLAPIVHDTFTPPSPSTPRLAPIVHDTFHSPAMFPTLASLHLAASLSQNNGERSSSLNAGSSSSRSKTPMGGHGRTSSLVNPIRSASATTERLPYLTVEEFGEDLKFGMLELR
ncbi:hypothetical protein BC829DRAFT_488602 [Chytridium lagenaria]|nr:hypothetical protein BC829DRAFT_488602 [Chytridium lagenaria]